MTTPWQNIPKSAPFILPEDREVIQDSNNRMKGTLFEVVLDQLPSPFVGDPEAPVILLSLNPGYAADTSGESVRIAFDRVSRDNLEHQFGSYPFYPLDPSLAGSPSGYEWWSLMLGPLIRASGCTPEKVSKKLFCVEYFPYHSVQFGWNGGVLPSQHYAIELIEKALARNAQIIIMRGRKIWERAMPALINNPNTSTLRNPRRTYISEGNMEVDTFERIIRLVRE